MVNHPHRRRVSATAQKLAPVVEPHDYENLITAVRHSFHSAIGNGMQLFRTSSEGLNEIYLDGLPSERQVHNCHACRHFIERYGDLVWVGADGKTHSVMWNPDYADEFYKPAFKRLKAMVEQRGITSAFVTDEPLWGQPVTGQWTHMAVNPPLIMLYREGALTAAQRSAALSENVINVRRALAEFSPKLLDELLRVMQSETLNESTRFIVPIQWLRALHDLSKGRYGVNQLWHAVAVAPEGFCHPRSSVLAPLLDDIKNGVPFDDMKRKFNAMVAPLKYQRPQAAPAAGNIVQAEKLVEKLGLEPSLHRRFALIEEVPLIWNPADAPKERAMSTGVFAGITPKRKSRAVERSVPSVDLPMKSITWAKFRAEVLPEADHIDFLAPGAGAYIALTTAVHPDAPPIFKWDHQEDRNPLAWYVYPGGSSAMSWGVAPGWRKLTGIAALPPMMGSVTRAHLGNGVVLIIEHCLDTNLGGSGLFPSCLKDDLHSVRSAIEAYSRSHQIENCTVGSACGYDVRDGGPVDAVVRVMINGGWSSYRIDRWD